MIGRTETDFQETKTRAQSTGQMADPTADGALLSNQLKGCQWKPLFPITQRTENIGYGPFFWGLLTNRSRFRLIVMDPTGPNLGLSQVANTSCS